MLDLDLSGAERGLFWIDPDDASSVSRSSCAATASCRCCGLVTPTIGQDTTAPQTPHDHPDEGYHHHHYATA